MDKPGFIGSSDGSMVRYEPKAPEQKKPAQALTRHQRATVCFKAVRFAKELLKSVGFREEAEVGHAGFTMSIDGFLLEVMVKEPPQMAHVTSYPGYQYDPKKINAKVTMACPTENGDYVIQLISTPPNSWTSLPVFIVVRQDSPDLLKEAFVNTLLSTRDALQKCPHIMAKVQAALAKRDIDKELEKMKAQDEPQALPPTQAKRLGY
jgi:hypothetical protein